MLIVYDHVVICWDELIILSSHHILQLYPDSNHNLDDVKYHFYRSMESYLMDCFKIKDGDDLIEMQKNPGKSAR